MLYDSCLRDKKSLCVKPRMGIKKMLKTISAKEVIKKFGISYQTLNHYTNIGLLNATKRRGNKRQYIEREVKKKLERINELKDKGYPLRIISQLINSK